MSKLEAGLVTIDTAELEQLAEALDVPVGLLMVEEQVFPRLMQFHRTKKAPRTELERIWAEHNMLRFALSRLLRAVDIRAVHQLPRYDIDEVGSAATAAKFVRAALGIPLGPIRNLVGVVDRAGIVVIGYDFRSPLVDATSHVSSFGELPDVVFLNSEAPGDRQRFSLAHELAHCVLHRYPTVSMEVEADKFAAEFLMPEDDIGPILRRKLDIGILGSLKTVWGCSMQAIVRRARDIEAMSESQYKRWMVTLSPYRKSEPIVVPAERADALSRLWGLHIDQLNWDYQQLREFVPLPHDLFRLAVGQPSLQVTRGPLKIAR